MRFVLGEYGAKHTFLGFTWLEPISYGYDAKGMLQSVLCKGPMSDGEIMLVNISQPDLSEDLMMNYKVVD
tara:strand:+ start:759 stop:968 length:210 start_codon:yes stop_codon:yes gene_type:complete